MLMVKKNKVFSECKDIENFDKEKVLEKALLRAFQNEIINISVDKNNVTICVNSNNLRKSQL